jgi:hypothetical protein
VSRRGGFAALQTKALCEWGRRHAAELDELDRLTEYAAGPAWREPLDEAAE